MNPQWKANRRAEMFYEAWASLDQRLDWDIGPPSHLRHAMGNYSAAERAVRHPHPWAGSRERTPLLAWNADMTRFTWPTRGAYKGAPMQALPVAPDERYYTVPAAVGQRARMCTHKWTRRINSKNHESAINWAYYRRSGGHDPFNAA